MFELVLRFAPSFHRHCSIRVIGEADAEATFEAPPSGLLPTVSMTRQVDAGCVAELRAACQAMLQGWDARWSESGLDGIVVDGTLETSDGEERPFMLWSPRKPSAAHAMLVALLACFPPELCNGAAGEQLEIIRSYFDIQPAVAVMGGNPVRFRLAPWVHRNHAFEVEQCIREMPDEAGIVIDASGVERFGPALPTILPMTYLRKRAASVRWLARLDAAQALLAAGVEPSDLEVVHQPPLTAAGQPIVLGGLVVSSSDLISLARRGAKLDLTRALRQEYRITVGQASQAAAELVELVRQLDASAVPYSIT